MLLVDLKKASISTLQFDDSIMYETILKSESKSSSVKSKRFFYRKELISLIDEFRFFLILKIYMRLIFFITFELKVNLANNFFKRFKTIFSMVIYHPNCLHISIDYSGTCKFKPTLFQLFRNFI